MKPGKAEAYVSGREALCYQKHIGHDAQICASKELVLRSFALPVSAAKDNTSAVEIVVHKESDKVSHAVP